MTSEHLMQHGRGAGLFRAVAARCALLIGLTIAASWCVPLGGCAFNREPRFVTPMTLETPYSPDRTVTVWAVAPMRNESGTSAVDPLQVSDALVAQLQQARGVQVLSLNRTLAAMRSIGLASIESQGDALRLAQELGVDAIVVGTITAYDPYDPLQLGLALALLAPAGSPIIGDPGATSTIDPYALQAVGTDFGLPMSGGAGPGPLSVVAAHYDGANHDVRFSAHRYAQGRTGSVSAMGWEAYLTSMRMFTKFACYDATARLLYQEQRRLAGAQRAAVSEE